MDLVGGANPRTSCRAHDHELFLGTSAPGDPASGGLGVRCPADDDRTALLPGTLATGLGRTGFWPWGVGECCVATPPAPRPVSKNTAIGRFLADPLPGGRRAFVMAMGYLSGAARGGC